MIEGERNDDFSLDLDEVERVIVEHRPDVVFLCSPNNPTGVVDPEASIRRVLELTAANGGLLCVDEAYGQFADFSAVTLLGDDTPLVVSRTYSKTWAMAAVRLGYLLAPSWVIDELEKVVLPYHLDAMTQIAGEVALDHLDAMNDRVAVWSTSASGWWQVSPTCRSTCGRQVQFCSPPTPAPVRRRRVAGSCRPIRARAQLRQWPRLQGCLRVTIGTPDEDDRFLKALTEVLT